MNAGGHLRDAARVLLSGHTESAKRSLDAAMEQLTPRELIRHGIRDDDGHTAAKANMHQVHRHRLAVQHIEDMHERNEGLRAAVRAAREGTPQPPDSIESLAASQDHYGILVTELSARTPYLAVTPAPRGRPGGPGLYRVKGMGHTAYYQQVVKALIEKRGMKPSKAYAIARAAIRKWAVRSRHPEVRGAAARAEAGEVARQARAHAHTAGPPAAVIELFNPYHAPTGQFTTASGAGQGQGKGSKQQRRAKLVRQIASIRSQIRALQAQLPAQHHTGKSRSSAPAKRGAGATSAAQARAAKSGAASSRSAAKSRAPSMSPATIHAKIAALRATLRADVAELAHL